VLIPFILQNVWAKDGNMKIYEGPDIGKIVAENQYKHLTTNLPFIKFQIHCSTCFLTAEARILWLIKRQAMYV
jgi:hypothetical protein